MKTSYNYENLSRISDARIAIVQAQWHHEHTDKMVQACTEVLNKAQVKDVEVIRVPGSYELSLAAKWLAKSKKYEALIIFGALVKGETDHYQVILDTCIRELGKVMYDYEVPVIMELLPVKSLEQLIQRTSGAGNKGIEAALAAIEMVILKRRLS